MVMMTEVTGGACSRGQVGRWALLRSEKDRGAVSSLEGVIRVEIRGREGD